MENPINFHCPRCKSTYIYFMNGIISCPVCKLSFNKDMQELLEDEYILSNEELAAIINVFKKNKIKSFSENLE